VGGLAQDGSISRGFGECFRPWMPNASKQLN
jgi:hypothetical protein